MNKDCNNFKKKGKPFKIPRRCVSLLICLMLISLCVYGIFPVKAESFFIDAKVKITKGLAHHAMGQMYDLLGMTNWAILEYEKASQFDEESYLTNLRLGADYAKLGMLLDAEEALHNVTKYNPEELQSRYLLALIYSNLQEYDKAAKEYEYILTRFSKEEPQNVEIYNYLGQLYYSQRKFDQAVEQFEKIYKLEPDNPDVMYVLGTLYLEVDRNDDAIDILKKAIEIAPNHDGCLNTLAYLYAEEGIFLDEAEGLIRRALEIDPDSGAYLDSLGWIYYKKGLYDKARETLVRAKDFVSDPVIYDHLGDVYMKLNNTDEALKNLEKSLEISPGQKEIAEKIEKIKNTQASRKE